MDRRQFIAGLTMTTALTAVPKLVPEAMTATMSAEAQRKASLDAMVAMTDDFIERAHAAYVQAMTDQILYGRRWALRTYLEKDAPAIELIPLGEVY